MILKNWIIGAILLFSANLYAEKVTTLKFGTIAPKGTIFYRYIVKFKKDVEKKTKNRIKIRIYAGGIAGSEKAMLRKLRSGNLDMAALTSVGLGQIDSTIKVLEVPLFYKNERQIDKARKLVYPILKKKFKQKGIILAGLTELGGNYLIAKKEIREMNDLKGIKIWAPTGDKLVKTVFQEFSIVPVYLSIEQVLPQLQTGGLDACFGPPVGIIGLQWYRYLKFMININMSYVHSGNVFGKKGFEKIPKDLQKLVIKISEKHMKKMISGIRRANRQSLVIIAKRGIKKVNMKKSEIAMLKRRSKAIIKKVIKKKLFSKALFKKIKKAIR